MDDQQQASPLPPVDDVVKTYNFFDAMHFLAGGKRITKQEWGDFNTYGLLSDGIVKIFINGKLDNWIISDGDLSGTDWIILE